MCAVCKKYNGEDRVGQGRLGWEEGDQAALMCIFVKELSKEEGKHER